MSATGLASRSSNQNLTSALREAEDRYIQANPKSAAIHGASEAAMPGGNTRTTLHYSPFPVCIRTAEGARVTDVDGHSYVDFINEYTAGVLGHSDPAVKAALAARDTAQRNFDKTTVVAPADGIISQVASLNAGQFIATGTTIASLIETGDTWIEANFKETELTHMHPGQSATVEIDTYPGVVFNATVESLSPGTGLTFSLLPAENARWILKISERDATAAGVGARSISIARSASSSPSACASSSLILRSMPSKRRLHSTTSRPNAAARRMRSTPQSTPRAIRS